MKRVVLISLISFLFFAVGLFLSYTFVIPFLSLPANSMEKNISQQPTSFPSISLTPTLTATPTATLTPVVTKIIATQSASPTPVSATTKKTVVALMPLGDSLTHGDLVPGGYRTELWRKLAADGDKINFVGSMSSGPPTLGDGDHEGHIGWEIGQVAGQIQGWIAADQPDIILLHIGSNDLDHGVPASEMTGRLSQLLGNIFAAKPNTYVIISSLVLTNRGDKANWLAYNASIPGVVAAYRNQGYKLVTIDMSNLLSESDLQDGLHPNFNGYNKMAHAWYPVVTTIYKEYTGTYGL